MDGFLQSLDHFLGALVAVLGFLGQGFEHHPFERFGDVRVNGAGQRQRVVDVFHQDGQGGIGVERRPTGQHLVEDDAQGVEVAGWAGLAR